MTKRISLLVFFVIAIALPYQLNGYAMHVAAVAVIFCILAVGLFLTMGIAGQINLAQVAFFGVGAYASAILTTQFGWGFWAAAVFGVVASLLMGLLIGIPALRVQSHYLGIVTLGLSLAFINFVSNSPIAGQAQGLGGLPSAELFGIDLSSDYLFYYLELIALIALIALASFVVNTRLGRRLRAMRDDHLAASTIGVEVPVLRMTAFAFGGLFGGVAGVLYAGLIRFVAPESFSISNMFFLLAMVVIGGRRSLPGVIFGAIILTTMREAFADFATYAQLAYGALVVIMVVFAPTGLAGIPGRLMGMARLARKAAGEGAGGVAPYVPLFDSDARASSGVRADSGTRPAAVEVKNLVKDFRGLRALNDVSLSVPEGEIRGIVGPNGSGKTTLFNVISGLYTPTSGSVVILGIPAAGKAPFLLSLRGLARTFQNLRLFHGLTVRENVMVGADRTKTLWSWRYALLPLTVYTTDRQLRASADELLSRYGLSAYADATPDALSYGAQRRVEIARAMATNPKVLLLDEPAAGLNGDEVQQLKGIVRDIRAQGVTVLIIEHNMGLMMSLCDKVTVLANGKVIADDKPSAVVMVPEVIEAYLGDDEIIDEHGGISRKEEKLL